MNRISIIGTGYVGLVTGTCLAEFGMNVVCMDIDETKIERLKRMELPIYEPGLETLLEKSVKSKRLKFTTDIRETIESSDVIFIAVGTPAQEDGSADLSYVLEVARQIAKYLDGYKVIVNKSTVPVGTARKVRGIVEEELKKRKVDFTFDVVSNPEFLREGAAVRDFMHPDRIVLGVENEKAEKIMKNIYNVLYLIDTPFVITNLESAEMIKYASNAFLATKISFINEVANLCDLVGADVHHVAKAMGMDGRIGSKFLHPGPGYGGSCFPKDTRAFINIANEYNYDLQIVKSVVDVNEKQRTKMIEKIESMLGVVKEKTIAILGLAFKPETDDMREAPSVPIIKGLLDKGAYIKVYDPIAMENARTIFADDRIGFCQNEYEAVQGADAVVLMTEWNQFRRLDLHKIKNDMKQNFFLDLRNVYELDMMREIGFVYEGVGRR